MFSPEQAKSSITILAVDDDMEVLTYVVAALRNHGFTVLGAHGPALAIQAISRNKDQIDLLLTDVKMPGISGPELAGQFLAIKPELMVVYMSGQKPDPSIHFVGMLSKPFTSQELVGAIHRRVASRATASPASIPPGTESLSA